MSMGAMRMCPWKRGVRGREDELPMYQEHYDALFSMDFVRPSTHMMTHEGLGIFEDVELVSRTCTWPSSCEFLASMRQLGDLVWVQLWRGNQVELQGKELQRVWATIADGVYSSSRSKAAQIRSPVLEICAQGTCQHLLCKEGDRDNQRGELKFLDMGIKPFSHAQAMARGSGEIDLTQGT
ncbi:unnamed protein product [Microthlaspi erraticum]|uniref:Arabidopsis retrotransposon Orf1 C-terminal domain-containing protein n=1 Tax=Microthlaspi erraticum TaxID=1685480 RepID=A0A6D2L6P8_9BRAS|nr:unnamed protein product [Microthlaspi erraticum]